MVKKRDRKEMPAVKNQTTASNIINSQSTMVEASLGALDKNAPRKHKGINVLYNEYEYMVIALAAKKDKRGITAFIRNAAVNAAEKLSNEEGF